jgi:hypothetical protein
MLPRFGQANAAARPDAQPQIFARCDFGLFRKNARLPHRERLAGDEHGRVGRKHFETRRHGLERGLRAGQLAFESTKLLQLRGINLGQTGQLGPQARDFLLVDFGLLQLARELLEPRGLFEPGLEGSR